MGASCGVMLVTRLPKRSTFSTTPRSVFPFTDFGLGAIEADKICDLFAELFRVNTLGQPGCDRRENIACMKGVADRLQGIVLGGDVANMQALFSGIDQREHAVVGRHKVMPVAGHQDRPPRRSHPGSTTTRCTVPEGKYE